MYSRMLSFFFYWVPLSTNIIEGFHFWSMNWAVKDPQSFFQEFMLPSGRALNYFIAGPLKVNTTSFNFTPFPLSYFIAAHLRVNTTSFHFTPPPARARVIIVKSGVYMLDMLVWISWAIIIVQLGTFLESFLDPTIEDVLQERIPLSLVSMRLNVIPFIYLGITLWRAVGLTNLWWGVTVSPSPGIAWWGMMLLTLIAIRASKDRSAWIYGFNNDRFQINPMIVMWGCLANGP